MSKLFKPLTLCACLLASSQVYASHDHRNYFLLGMGGFVSSAGEEQHINITNLIGNQYTVSDGTDVKPLVGLGYFWNVLHQKRVDLDVGANAYYLFPAYVKGHIFQEDMFENLNYEYSIENLPIYAELRANIKNSTEKMALTLDLGIGPNVMMMGNYDETSRDAVTIPNDSFSNTTAVTFSATAGVGVKFYHAAGSPAVEIGYRFFYLGESELNKNVSLINDDLKTGTVYANALVFSITI